MGFLSPWFLLGTLAVGIPLWVHLIRREQALKLPFSSLMFLHRVPIKSVSRQRLKHFLLLATRMLLIVLFALIFAQPYFPWASRALSGPGEARQVVILLDTSMSMQYGERWSRALAAARETIANLGEQDRAQIATFASNFQVLNLPTTDKAALLAVLENVATPLAFPTSYAQAFRAVEVVAEDAELPLAVVLISDLQKTGMENFFSAVSLPPGTDLRVVNVAEESNAPNWTIEGVRSRRAIYRARYPDRIAVQVRGFAPAAATKEVAFSLGGKAVQKKNVQVPSAGVATAIFESFDVPLGANLAKIEISPSDELPLDDAFHFILERREPDRLLFLRESNAADELYYIRNALAAEADSPFALDARTPAEAVSMRLHEYAMVILSNSGDIPAALRSALRTYVKQGGGLLITMGNRFPAPSLESDLQELWPGKTLERRLLTSEGERLVLLGEFAKDHPIFREWQEDGAQSLRTVEVYGYVRVQPEGAVLLRFSNGDPALVEKQHESGRVLLFTSSFDNVWSDFPLHPAFVPLVHQLVKYGAQLPETPPAYRIPSGVSLANLLRGSGEESAQRIWEILDPDGTRETPLSEAAPRDFLALRKPGFYQVRQRDQAHWIAANPDPRESDLTPLAPEDRAFLEEAAQAPPGEAGAAVASVEARQQSLWWYLLLAGLLLAGAEVYLANQYLGPKRIAVAPETNQERSYVV